MSIFPPICCNDKLGSFESAQHAWGIFGAQRALEGLGCALSGASTSGVPRLVRPSKNLATDAPHVHLGEECHHI